MNFLFYSCKNCQESYAISELDPELSLLKRVMACPNGSACEGKMNRSSPKPIPPGFRGTQIGALKLYQACMGVGLPGERNCNPRAVKKVLVGARVMDCHVLEAPDASRSLIFSLTLDNGKTVHIANSGRGATIYKITEVKNGR